MGLTDPYRKWLRKRVADAELKKKTSTNYPFTDEMAMVEGASEIDPDVANRRAKAALDRAEKTLQDMRSRSVTPPVSKQSGAYEAYKRFMEQNSVATAAEPMVERDAYSTGYGHGQNRRAVQPGAFDRELYMQGYLDGKGDRERALKDRIEAKLPDVEFMSYDRKGI